MTGTPGGILGRTVANLAGLLVTAMAAMAAAPLSAQAADAVLSGTITSASGEKMAGVTVSAKPEGSTITTSVYTDQQGNYYFPPMPAGKYRVWAQALTFERSNGAVDLAAARRADRDRRFVGHDLDHHLVLGDAITFLHVPADDLAFGYALADVGQFELEVRHG